MLYWIPAFKEELKQGLVDLTPIRGVQIDLDKIVDPASYRTSDANLGKCLDRLENLGVNTVIVRAFSGGAGTDRDTSLYYHNSVMPVKMDFLSHAVNRIKARGMVTFVWMPALGFRPPGGGTDAIARVCPPKKGPIDPAACSCKGLSPFDPATLAMSRALFRDLAAYVDFDGLLFQDEACVTDGADSQPGAAEAFREAFGVELTPLSATRPDIAPRWRRLKARALENYLGELSATVRIYRPSAKIARDVHVGGEGRRAVRARFAEDLDPSLQKYDYTVIRTFPETEKTGGRLKARKWIADLVGHLRNCRGAGKVIFTVQAYDRAKNRWVEEDVLKDDLSFLLSQGARHVVYYPDGVIEDKPKRDAIASIISGQECLRGAKDKSPVKK
jgi:biofilm PGA synthesis lipoprotein PgaB